METALYFPFMRAPQTPWFTQVILYWDKAATIVPTSLRERDEVFGPYMSDLVGHDLVETISPDETVWDIPGDFGTGFLDVLDSSIEMPDSRHWRRRRMVVGGGPFRPGWTLVHAGKAQYALFEGLAQRGLAHQGPRWDWWEVAEHAADLYMTYLTGAICGTRDGLFPITDSIQSIADLGPPDQDAEIQLRKLRYTAIMRALPVPAGTASAHELASFKDGHQEELVRLRRFLDGKIADIALIDDDHIRQVRTEAVCQEIEDQIINLREKMTKKVWPKVTFNGIGGVLAAAIATSLPFTAGGGALAMGLGAGAGLVSVGTATYNATEVLRSPRYDRRAPLVYAALAQGL
ncbi:hypothetical protein [Streptomyces tubercidicus]